MPKGKVKMSLLNAHLICGLCGGYLVDATVLTQCIHAFCRSCILKHLATQKTCPLCQNLIHETRPGYALRPDVTLQRVVYKLVPGLLRREMGRMREFHHHTVTSSPTGPPTSHTPSLSSSGSASSATAGSGSTKSSAATPVSFQSSPSMYSGLANSPESISPHSNSWTTSSGGTQHQPMDDPPDQISLALSPLASFTRSPVTNSRTASGKEHRPPSTTPTSIPPSSTTYLLCPAELTVGQLHRFLLCKHQLNPTQWVVDLFLRSECLEPQHSLQEVIFLYSWPRTEVLSLEYCWAEPQRAWWGQPMPRLRRSSEPGSDTLNDTNRGAALLPLPAGKLRSGAATACQLG